MLPELTERPVAGREPAVDGRTRLGLEPDMYTVDPDELHVCGPSEKEFARQALDGLKIGEYPPELQLDAGRIGSKA